jgi:NTE family protein
MYYRQLGEPSGFFDMPLYVGGSLEAGNVWQNRSEITAKSLIINGSLFAGVDTYVGLLFLGAGFSEAGESSFYLFLGDPRR